MRRNAGAIVSPPLPQLGSTSPESLAFLDLSEIASIIEHRRADQVISLETGMTLSRLDEILCANEQWWPVAMPGESTVYDVIACGDGGALEHSAGGPRNLILGLHTAMPNGQCIKSGGKVVKNVTGYDMTKLFIGTHGALGIPVSAHLRLAARPQHRALIGLVRAGDEQLAYPGAKVDGLRAASWCDGTCRARAHW